MINISESEDWYDGLINNSFSNQWREISKKNKSIYLGKITTEPYISCIKKARDFFRPNAFFGYQLAKNVSALIKCHPDLEFDFFATDENGVIKNSASDLQSSLTRAKRAKLSGQPIVLIFGGSTVMGEGARLPKYSIPSQVQSLVKERFKAEICCINFGVSGYSSIDSANVLNQDLIQEYEPDLIIFYDGWNCCLHYGIKSLISSSDALRSNMDSNSSQGIYSLMVDNYLKNSFNLTFLLKVISRLFFLNTFSFFGSLFKRNFFNDLLLRIPIWIGPRYFYGVIRKYQPSSEEFKKQLAVDSCSRYITVHQGVKNLCDSNGVKFVTCLQPLIFFGCKPLTASEKEAVIDYEHFAPNFFYSALQKNYFSNTPNTYDLTGVFDSVEEEVYIDSGHINALGNSLVAEKLVNILQVELLECYLAPLGDAG